MHPEMIGSYRIDRKIGAGGMGNVYRGVHTETGQVAAIKVLPASMAREDGFVQRFTREISALKQLSNRHIVQLYGNGETPDGSYYYAMEYVDGVTLTSDIIDRKRIPWPEVIELTLQIVSALKAAHDAGIVHRDLKPSNLMLTQDRVIKLTDFGVAHVFASTRLTRTGGIVGTAEYMSPEQAKGQRATGKSDLYSLGVVMYTMLVGKPPFTGQTANDILQKHQFSQFDRPARYVPEIPRLLEELVCQLLEKDPGKRPGDAVVLLRRLEQIRSRIEYTERQQQIEDRETQTRTMREKSPDEGTAADYPTLRSGEHHPGPATLVRDVLRNDAAESLHKSAVSRFFDNTFVLIALLGLIVFGGFYMMRRNSPEPLQQLDRARTILASRPGTGWLRARDETLQPLLTVTELSEYREEIREMIAQVDQYEFSRSLRVTVSSGPTAQSEIQRLVRRAFETYSTGNPAEAIQNLESIMSMIQGDRQYRYLRQFLLETLQQWSSEQTMVGRRRLLETVLNSARNEAREQRFHSAEDALQAAIAVYGTDESVAAEVNACREMLKELEDVSKTVPRDAPVGVDADADSK
jgi:serine/threonine protein kinase